MDFEYMLGLDATPEHIFSFLTEPELTQRWWETSFATDWRPGSTMIWTSRGVVIEDPAQQVLAYEPWSTVAFTWHTFTEEIGRANDIPADVLARVRAESRTRVTFHVQSEGPHSTLTLTHEGFGADSVLLEWIRDGWPPLMEKLKLLVEA